jgi:enediyne biosynthesis protein E4
MTPFAFLRRVPYVAIVLVAFAACAYAQARHPTTPPTEKEKKEPLVFGEVTSRFHLSLTPVARPAESAPTSIQIKSQDYSLDYARRVLLPAIGGSIAVGDFDHDGHPDLYVTVPGGSNHLFQNLPDGTFVDATQKANVAGTGFDLAAAFGDYDKSGNPSLFVAGLGGVTVYHNNGDGTFTNVTAKAGLKTKPGELATSVLLFDAGGEGFLDALVTIYTDFSSPPKKSAFTFPNDFVAAESHLYRNQHDGTFREITEEAGLTGNPGRTHMALAADFNHNGRMDVLLLRDDKPPALFRNHGQGKFEDQTWDAGAEIWKYAYVEGQVADFDHDGKLDAALWSTVGDEVLINQGKGKFDDLDSLPLVYAANRAFGIHGITGDLTGDGWDDLLTIDNQDNWHFLVNHKGKFAESPFVLAEEKTAEHLSHTAPTESKPPRFAAMTTAHLGKSTKIQIIALTMDGQLEIFEAKSAGGSPPTL